MAGINVKMGVSGVSEFKRGISDAESAVKALTKALDLNEAQLNATGNQELYLQNKTENLKAQIEAQTKVVQQAQAALDYMKSKGVDQASKAFQDMQGKVYSAGAKLLEMKTELAAVESGAKDAGQETAGMNKELKEIGKGIGWQNVSEGLEKITSKLASAGRAAISFGQKMARYVGNSAEWADELKTTADQFDIDVETLQRMRNVSAFIDTDVDAILTAQSRMMKAASSKSGKATIEETLGLSLDGQTADDLFWEIGDALMNMGDAFDKEGAAQTVFGRSWRELLPLFKAGREEYDRMLEEQNVMSAEDVDKLGAVDDTIQSIRQEIELMKNQFIADNADKIQGLLQWVLDNKDGVVTGITAIGAAFGALKLAEMATSMMQLINGFNSLKIFGGAGSAASAATSATATAATAAGGGLLSTIMNYVPLIGAAVSMYEATEGQMNRQRKEREERIAENTVGMSPEAAEVYKLTQMLGLSTEAAWEYWEKKHSTTGSSAGQQFGTPLPSGGTVGVNADSLVSAGDRRAAYLERNLDRMTAVQESTAQSNSEVAAAISGLDGLPAAVAAAVQAGMSSVTITIGAGAVDAIGNRVGKGMYNNIVNMVN